MEMAQMDYVRAEQRVQTPITQTHQFFTQKEILNVR